MSSPISDMSWTNAQKNQKIICFQITSPINYGIVSLTFANLALHSAAWSLYVAKLITAPQPKWNSKKMKFNPATIRQCS